MNSNETVHSPVPTPGKLPKFNILHVLLTLLLLGGLIATYFLSDIGNILAFILWCLCALLPFSVILLIILNRGIPAFLCNRFGGVILLLAFGGLITLIPTLVSALWLFLGACLLLGLIKTVFSFLPSEMLRVTYVNKRGETVRETKFVYEDDPLTVHQVRSELQKEGGKNIQIDKISE